LSDFETILRATFRANPAYELVLFDRLPEGERTLLADLARDPSFYGVLRPRPSGAAPGLDAAGLGVKSVDRETALLVLTLAEAAPLPAYVRELFGHDTGRAVAQLVADGVLEVAEGDGFVSGARAFHLVARAAREDGEEPGAVGAIAALSRDALRYAQALPIEEPLRLSGWIYGYNRRPITPRWRRLLPDAAAVPAFLGIAPGQAAAASFARRWAPLAPTAAWISWQARAVSRKAEWLPASGPTYKLYVSPEPDFLAGGGFAAIAAALAEARAPHFKVGSDAAGLLRPDKIVAYFSGFEALAGAAERLRERLDGAPAHGVPFTAEIAGGGLLSWGVDPPRGQGLPWAGQESWRLWLTHRLARALLSARAGASPAAAGLAGEAREPGIEPWRFAVERLRLEGVDTDTWTPGALLWREG
jgi:hypothetical protein